LVDRVRQPLAVERSVLLVDGSRVVLDGRQVGESVTKYQDEKYRRRRKVSAR
jgi:hypothetical protein